MIKELEYLKIMHGQLDQILDECEKNVFNQQQFMQYMNGFYQGIGNLTQMVSLPPFAVLAKDGKTYFTDGGLRWKFINHLVLAVGEEGYDPNYLVYDMENGKSLIEIKVGIYDCREALVKFEKAFDEIAKHVAVSMKKLEDAANKESNSEKVTIMDEAFETIGHAMKAYAKVVDSENFLEDKEGIQPLIQRPKLEIIK